MSLIVEQIRAVAGRTADVDDHVVLHLAIDEITALLSAHSELERVREALEKTGTQLSVTLQWIDNWNPSFAEDEEWRGDRRRADEAVQSARAALSPQPPKEEMVTPSELEAAHRQGYIAGQVEEAARRSPAIRREALEEAARVAERIWDEGQQGAHGGEQALRTAAAIRSLMDVEVARFARGVLNEQECDDARRD